MNLRLAYSPDADDAFMFRAALDGLIDTEGLTFEGVTADTQRLNELADSGEIDVCAISVAAYPFVAERFALLISGGSVGMGYGPVIVAKKTMTVDQLSTVVVATPGVNTTAQFISLLICPQMQTKVVPITPYEAIFDAINDGSVDAGIIIHEGRLVYERHGLKLIVDIGDWWMKTTGLPLPLGANIIRRGLGSETMSTASRVLQRSIRWALDNREDMISYLLSSIHRPAEVATRDLMDRYLAMYANEETYQYSTESKQAMQRIFDIGFDDGRYPTRTLAEFV